MKVKFKLLNKVKQYKMSQCDNSLFPNPGRDMLGCLSPKLMMIPWKKSFSSEGKSKIKRYSGFSRLLPITVVLSQVRKIKLTYLGRSKFENCWNYF